MLVLERHFKAGGFTHDFQRQQFHWDVGIHYVGQMNEGSSTRQLFDLVTRKGVQWQQMPEPFEKFVYPNLTFNLYGDPKRFQADLIQQFPQEQPAIRQYFRYLPIAATALFLHIPRLNGNWLFKSLGYLGKLWSPIGLDLTTKDYLVRVASPFWRIAILLILSSRRYWCRNGGTTAYLLPKAPLRFMRRSSCTI
ncbi:MULTISPECIES: hypothetical protein [unclassified Chamaesiphon]|uniref:hypothetical protein n=1 Tax=unclassified Chamaesiphon TaxID=2620921 RepID=UPI00286BAB3E|nr:MULTISPECIES: hypothetical protein [unclassified Chamaesiphon]